ncbi:MAG: hypothetical protein JWP01_2563 [Myxococcales bacterium]|nr:hypothetical protein [Myxococcales bacterium]
MLRHLMLLVLVACSSKTDAPAPAPTPALSFVPAELANQLAGANLVLAVNFERTDLSPLLLVDWLPPNAGCARDLVSSLGVAVFLISADASATTVHATKLPERETRACLDQLMPVIGGATGVGPDGSYELRVGEHRFSLTWKNGVVTAGRQGAPAVGRGAPSPEMRTLIGHVPATANVFYLAMAYPDHKIKNLIGWAQIVGDAIEMQMRAEGTEPGVVQPWLQTFIDDFNAGAEAKHIPVDHRWFNGTLAEPVGKIEGRLPMSVFAAAFQGR